MSLDCDAGGGADARRKIERVGNTTIRSVSESQLPKTVDHHSIPAGVVEQATKLAALWVKRADRPWTVEARRAVVEVADQQRIAEFAEFRRRKRDASRVVERTSRRKAPEEVPVGIKDVHGSDAGHRYAGFVNNS